jgi:hypothetical protein
MHHVFDVAEKRHHHGPDDKDQQREAAKDRQRHADEVHLHLRHEPRQNAQSEIEEEPERQKGCR